MTEPITLTLTLEELKLIDKYVEFNDDTQQLFEKIKSAYPRPKMILEHNGKFEVVSYNDEFYVRMDYSYDILWYKSKNTKNLDGNNLTLITDGETHRLLEGLWFNEIRKGRYTD